VVIMGMRRKLERMEWWVFVWLQFECSCVYVVGRGGGGLRGRSRWGCGWATRLIGCEPQLYVLIA